LTSAKNRSRIANGISVQSSDLERAMKKQKIPKQVEGILDEDETIEESFDLKGCHVYATDRRLLMKQGRTVRDFDYAHISSVAYSSKHHRGLVIPGILLCVLGGWLLGTLLSTGIGSAGIGFATIIALIIGGVLILSGLTGKSEWVEINVAGVASLIKFAGSRQDLDSLLHIIRQKRTTKPAISKTETKGIDVADTIRKLADLRNEGVITEEEFEEKKSKLTEVPLARLEIKADFTVSRTEIVEGDSIHFTDQSTGDITSRLWDFGGGSTSTARNPSHTYHSPRSYTVSLKVSGPAGSSTTKSGLITVLLTADAGGGFTPSRPEVEETTQEGED